jgi:hypothetical protein
VGVIPIDQEDASSMLGECFRNRLSDLPFATHTREYHAAPGEVHVHSLHSTSARIDDRGD